MSGRVRQAWLSYFEQVIPNGAPPVQVEESRRAFYAGAQALFGLLNQVTDDEGLDPTEAELARVEEIYQELQAFLTTIGSQPPPDRQQ